MIGDIVLCVWVCVDGFVVGVCVDGCVVCVGAGEELVAILSYIQHMSMVSLRNSFVCDYKVKVAGKYNM